MSETTGLMFDRRSLLQGTAVGAPMLWLPWRAAAAVVGDPIAETEYGKVRGTRVNGVEIYRGVPYGGSVSGAARFSAPTAVTPWQGVRDATRPGAPSIQPPKSSFGVNEPAPAEDCLSLTVWTPAADGKRRPVMVYSHGGGFTTGSGSSVYQDGANLARMYDVVVVATNHRLGMLGYLYLDEIAGDAYRGSGNNGMRDIVAGLSWVHRNIERFGGDPANVMIFGESGGGAKTSCLYAMPSAEPYFNKASIESGPGIRMTAVENARRSTDEVLRQLSIAPADWRKLLEVPAETLLALQLKIAGMPNSGVLSGDKRGIGATRLGFGPVVDGGVLPANPFDPSAPAISKDKPLICGYNHDEFAFFAMVGNDVAAFNLDEAGLETRLSKEMPDDYKQAIEVYRGSRPNASPADIYIAIRSARFAGTGSIIIAERKFAQHAAPIYAYTFTYQLERTIPGTTHPLGAMHALEIPFKFYNVENVSANGGPNFAGDRPERYAAGRNMSSMWANFARAGKPSAAGQPAWPAYNLDKRPTMMIDAKCTVVNDPTGPERRFWEARAD
jgi:para-nitrobenzyl esterase